MFYLLGCLQGGILFLFMNFLFMVYIYTYFCTLSPKSKELFNNDRKNLILLKQLENTALTLDDLTSKVSLSKSSVSRRVRVLKSAYLVETAIFDRKMLASISETGLKLLHSNKIVNIN